MTKWCLENCEVQIVERVHLVTAAGAYCDDVMERALTVRIIRQNCPVQPHSNTMSSLGEWKSMKIERLRGGCESRRGCGGVTDRLGRDEQQAGFGWLPSISISTSKPPSSSRLLFGVDVQLYLNNNYLDLWIS